MPIRSILAVDDSRLARMMLREAVLKSRPECVFREAGTAEEALNATRQQIPDLFLIDLNMPGMNGIDLAMEISRIAPGVPMALLTANIQDKVKLRAESIGLIFLEKPISSDRLGALLAQLDV
ncbi:MAG: response regulator [Magnetococcales bacterium]|nr:response regulator [Magnetococcales bacterium]